MFGVNKSEKKFSCPSCGDPLRVGFWGSGIDKSRCPECGADLIFDHSHGSCRVSLGFMRSGMHGPMLSQCGMIGLGNKVRK